MKLYVTHAIEVHGDTSAADLRSAIRHASNAFANDMAHVADATFTTIRSIAPPTADAGDLAAFVAAEVCRD